MATTKFPATTHLKNNAALQTRLGLTHVKTIRSPSTNVYALRRTVHHSG
jgi:hypothetical protein